MYVAFNARELDRRLDWLTEDVDWPNVAAGTRVQGRDAVRRYWDEQLGVIDPRVTPIGFRDEGGQTVVTVRQTIRDLGGNVLSEESVEHVYSFRDGKVARMDVRSPLQVPPHVVCRRPSAR